VLCRSKKGSQNSPIRQGESAPKKELKGKTKVTPSSSTMDIKATDKSVALYSYSPDVSPEFQKRVDDFVSGTEASLRARLARQAMGESTDIPFASVREGERLNIIVPLMIQRGDALAELIMLIASKVPTAVLLEGTVGWSEPIWTSESSRHLMGLVAAVQGSPNSFASSSSPVDLARLAVWVSACNSALSVPGGVENTVGAVLPSEIGGAKSASKYLSKVFASLRAVSSENNHLQAINTLERLLKLWYKSIRAEALELVRKNKINWGTVLLAGSPTEKKKVKGVMITHVRAPAKPSRSPFLSGKEKQVISSILAPVWNRPDQLRTAWNDMAAEQQHASFGNYVKSLKEHYDNINKISTSMHSKLGHRKKWIHAACDDKDAVPSKKKDKSNEFIWTANFFKLDLTDINLSVALVFAPSHYLVEQKYESDTILARLFGRNRVLQASEITEQLCGVTTDLWREWVARFEPDMTLIQGAVPEATTLQDTNPFGDLPEAPA